MNKQLKTIPKFANKAQERAFWEANDSTDHLDWSKTNKVPNTELPTAITALDAAARTKPSNYPEPFASRMTENGSSHTKMEHPIEAPGLCLVYMTNWPLALTHIA